MIIALIVATVVGLLVGVGEDALLRGRDPRSWFVVAAGVVGAIAGLVARRAFGDAGLLIGSLTALFGALLLAFGTRVRRSTGIARVSP